MTLLHGNHFLRLMCRSKRGVNGYAFYAVHANTGTMYNNYICTDCSDCFVDNFR